MNLFKYIFKSMGGFFYPFAFVVSAFIYGSFQMYFDYGDTIGFYTILPLCVLYLIIFYIDLRKNKKNKTGLFREDNGELGR